jgi:hypothetical protein
VTSFLFWNLKNNPLENVIGNLALKYKIDVLMFVECSIPSAVLLKSLNRAVTEYFYAPSIGCEKVEIYTRFPYRFALPLWEDARLTIRNLKLPNKTNILLAVTHFPSKNNQRDASQAMASVELVNAIKMAEKEVGHSKTVLVGDLNMNPFEDGVISANGLHGTMSRSIALKKNRTIGGREYLYFYNPMWSLFGDADSGTPPGTYYYNNSEYINFFWNMFDQVLIRPDLLNSFENERLKILTSDGDNSFLTPNGLPNAKQVSDHLPILFHLDL